MRINFDPDVEQDEGYASNPAQDVEQIGMSRWCLKERYRHEEVGQEVIEKDDVDKVAEHNPDLTSKR